MKNLIILAFIFLSYSFNMAPRVLPNDQDQKKEYVIVRVTFADKKTGITARMSVDLGSINTHTLFGKVEVTENQGLRFVMPDGQIKIANTEADMLNCFSIYGFHPVYLYPMKITTQDYLQYILEKE